MPRFFVDLPLSSGLETALPESAARHVQVLRLQPGDTLSLFDGRGADWFCEVTHMGRSEVKVRVGEAREIECELPLAVTLAVGMPANDRMDWLIEKATELGVSEIQPLMCERSVLRLSGDRAERKLEHWRGVSVAACEQSGRATLPRIAPVQTFAQWLASLRTEGLTGFVLSLADGAIPYGHAIGPALRSMRPLLFVSGPEGGLSPGEDSAARTAGLEPVSLGSRVLRAETAPLAALATLASLFA